MPYSGADLLLANATDEARPADHDALLFGDRVIAIGDVVVHTDHGLARLDGLEVIELDDASREVVRLSFKDDERLLVPVEEADRIWRYAGESAGVALDVLGSDDWKRRAAELTEEVTASARSIAAALAERAEMTAQVIAVDRERMDRFAEGFTHELTADQSVAIDAVLSDLASGTPMDRLLVGDVGYGKTEVALRAIAAAAFSGLQVAIIEPTTLLARQVADDVASRFEGTGVRTALLCGTTSDAKAARLLGDLADGTVRVVVGTHALFGEKLRFASLGLVVLDEEQLFGSAQKTALTGEGDRPHLLTMTATPIPRTLAEAGAGLKTVSVVATPPRGRSAVRTRRTIRDDEAILDALATEKARGGASFLVSPRIEGLAPLRALLAEHAPSLRVRTAHGELPADEAADAVRALATGEADVLLATSLVGNGVDVPCANTMIVTGAEMFGLAQLHQLRGRVGRGGGEADFLLLHDAELTEDQDRRLGALEEEDRLGAGFALSVRDLDHRGAGDLFGDEQAGHVHALGVGLYRHLLQEALENEVGKQRDLASLSPKIHAGPGGRIPAGYVPSDQTRLRLYARIAHARRAEALAAIETEMKERFGPLPAPASTLMNHARLRLACGRAGVATLDAGPAATAVTFTPEAHADEGLAARIEHARDVIGACEQKGLKLVFRQPCSDEAECLDLALRIAHSLALVSPSA